MLSRKPDWPSRLDTYLTAHAAECFRYGRLDCCLFVCDAVLAMTGVDLAAPFRGRYSSRKGALRELAAYAGKPSVKAVAEKVAAENGMPEVPVRSAGRGDVLLLARSRDHSLALVALNGRDALVTSRRGLWRLPLAQLGSQIVRAWRV